MALRAERVIFLFSTLINIALFCFISYFKDSVGLIFTAEQKVVELVNQQMQMVLVVCFFDFCQAVKFGSIKAL